MYTAMLTVENIVDGARHDIWAVNVDEEYQEQKTTPSGPVASRNGSAAGAPRTTGTGTGGGVSTGTGREAPILPRRESAHSAPVND